MKPFLLILIFVICCSLSATALPSSSNGIKQIEDLKVYFPSEKTKEFEEFVAEKTDELFENFTELFQDQHPSVADAFKMITTCIERKGMVGELKQMVIDIFKISSKKEKEEYCSNKNNEDIKFKILECFTEKSQPRYPFSEELLYALYKTNNFLFSTFCLISKWELSFSSDYYNMTSIFQEGVAEKALVDMPKIYESIQRFRHLIENGIIPSEKDSCLPIHVTEAYEIIMLKTRTTNPNIRGDIANFIHVAATILGKFPFKSREECLVEPEPTPKNTTIEKGKNELFLKYFTEKTNDIFENFTYLFQDNHPSTTGTMKNITTCIEQNGHVKKLKQYMIDSATLLFNDTSWIDRINFCQSHGYDFRFVYNVVDCLRKDVTPENQKFLMTVKSAINFHHMAFCSLDSTKYLSIFEEDIAKKALKDMPKIYASIQQFPNLVEHGITPSEKDSCLPIRVTEAYEIIMLKTKAVSLVLREYVADYVHVATTLLGKFPFKTREECV